MFFDVPVRRRNYYKESSSRRSGKIPNCNESFKDNGKFHKQLQCSHFACSPLGGRAQDALTHLCRLGKMVMVFFSHASQQAKRLITMLSFIDFHLLAPKFGTTACAKNRETAAALPFVLSKRRAAQARRTRRKNAASGRL
jgi:hypothetical protein